MDISVITIFMFGSMFLLMLLGIPLGIATGGIAAVFLMSFLGIEAVPLITTRIYDFIDNYALVALPFFIFMASVMERGGVAHDLYDAIRLWAGRLRGGIGAMTVIVAMVLAAMSGVIGGEIVLLGLIALPQMLRLGYDKDLAIGTVAAGGSLGTMIPPSINLIIFGLTANVSISQLFLASATPGVLMGMTYIVYILIRCYLNPALGPIPSDEELDVPLSVKLTSLKNVILPLLIAFSVLGSIYAGIASVSEAAGVGAFAMVLAIWFRGKLTADLLKNAMVQTIRTSGMVLWLIFGAVSLVGVYNLLGGSAFIRELLTGLDVSPIVIILIMCAVFMVLGCLMDGTAICLLTVPIFAPIVSALEYDLIWFGIIFAITCQTGYISPPFGTAAFYLKGVAPKDIEITDIFRALLPFVGLQLIILAAILFAPSIALWPL
jgi:tripartite ATP-independent transporter DctM subunit